MVAPVLERLAVRCAGRVKVVKVNVHDNPRAAARFDAQSIPTLAMVRNVVTVGRVVAVGILCEAFRPLIGGVYLLYGLALPVWFGMVGWRLLRISRPRQSTRTARATGGPSG